jgi:hypothetical protein
MLPDIRTACQLHVENLEAYATSGRKTIMELAEYLNTQNDTLPEELRPLGQALTDMTMKILTESYVECLMMISELGLQEITRGAQGNQQKECFSGCPSHRVEGT